MKVGHEACAFACWKRLKKPRAEPK